MKVREGFEITREAVTFVQNVLYIAKAPKFLEALTSFIYNIPFAQAALAKVVQQIIDDELLKVSEDAVNNKRIEIYLKLFNVVIKNRFDSYVNTLQIENVKENDKILLEIQDKFPQEMQKFTNICNILSRGNLGKKLSLILENLKNQFESDEDNSSILQNIISNFDSKVESILETVKRNLYEGIDVILKGVSKVFGDQADIEQIRQELHKQADIILEGIFELISKKLDINYNESKTCIEPNQLEPIDDNIKETVNPSQYKIDYGVKSLEKLLSEMHSDEQDLITETDCVLFITKELPKNDIFNQLDIISESLYIRVVNLEANNNRLYYISRTEKVLHEITCNTEILNEFDRLIPTDSSNTLNKKQQLSCEDLESIRLVTADDYTSELLRTYYRNHYSAGNCTLVNFKTKYCQIKDLYNKNWQNANILNIQNWAASKKGNLKNEEILESIAVMDRANELATLSNNKAGHRLRDTQILSLLSFLETEENQGKLCQINTGEGKTTIVSLLATIKALKGETVDIITSNPVLASEGVKDKESFYKIMGLTVAHNNSEVNYNYGARTCYESDVVYGSISSFQFDYLRDVFLDLKTRGDRNFGSVVLDEVDSMIIDNGSNIAKLSSPFPGMESFKYIYINIWKDLIKAERQFVTNRLDKALEELREQDISTEEMCAELGDRVKSFIRQQIKLSDPTNIELIPEHLKEYVNGKLDKWIDNALYAKNGCHENEQYIIRKNDNGECTIMPVDNVNTGITLKNTIWSNALHQFLQLKHNLELTPESITSCFISNLGYIKKYRSNIYGLTGTMGSKAEQELIKEVYNVEFDKIPTYKVKNFIELEGIIESNGEWAYRVAEEALDTVNDEARAVLVICNTIADLQLVQNSLEELRTESNNPFKIQTYQDEDSSRITEKELNVGDIVIATNLAGRGTDFRTTKKLEENGGLHVCIGFLPVNQRVEDQAMGRTSRQGKQGTAQLIIRESEINKLKFEYENVEDIDFVKIKERRNELEKQRLKDIKDIKVKEIDFQDQLFDEFLILYKEKDSERKGKEDYGVFKEVLKELKECWAFWLEKKDFSGEYLPDNIKELQQRVSSEFKQFKEETKEIISGKIVHNPYYVLQQAEIYLQNGKINKAEEVIKYIINLKQNPKLLTAAYLKLFEVALEKGNQIMLRFKKALGKVVFIKVKDTKEDYKTNAIEYLDKATEAINKELNILKKLLGIDCYNLVFVFTPPLELKEGQLYVYTLGYELYYQAIGKAKQGIAISNELSSELLLKLQTVLFPHLVKDLQNGSVSERLVQKTKKDAGEIVSKVVDCAQEKILSLSKNYLYSSMQNTLQSSVGRLVQHTKNQYLEYDLDEGVIHPDELEDLTQNDIEEIFRITEKQGYYIVDCDFQSIITAEVTENLFLKHLNSRYICLQIYLGNIEGLKKQIEDNVEEGLAIGSRVPNYLNKLDSNSEQEKELKESITANEISELGSIGLDTIYALRTVYDVPEHIIVSAQAQISSGLTALAIGLAFPPSLPAMGPIAGTLISEGICDIALELISQGHSEFNQKEYAKGKAISYGISVATMGIGAAMASTKILNGAIKCCQGLSKALRASPMMQGICKKVATQIDKIEKYLTKSLEIAKFAKLSKIDQLENLQYLQKAGKEINHLGGVAKLEHLSKLKEAGKLVEITHLKDFALVTSIVAKSTVTTVGMSIFMEHVVTKSLNELLQGIKHQLEEKIRNAIEEKCNSDKNFQNKLLRQKDLSSLIEKIMKENSREILGHIAKEISLGVLKHSSNWKVKALYLTIDNIISVEEIKKFTDNFCKKLADTLENADEDAALTQTLDLDQIIKILSEQASEQLYSMIVSLSGKNVTALPKIIQGVATDSYKILLSAKEKYEHNKEVKKQLKQHFEKSAKDVGEKLGSKDCAKGALSLMANDEGRDISHIKGLESLKTADEIATVVKELKGSNPLMNKNVIGHADSIKYFMRKNHMQDSVILLQSERHAEGHAVRVIKIKGTLYLQDPQNTSTPLIKGTKAINEYLNSHCTRLDIIGAKSSNGSRSFASKLKNCFTPDEYYGDDAAKYTARIEGVFGAKALEKNDKELPSLNQKQKDFIKNTLIPELMDKKDSIRLHSKNNDFLKFCNDEGLHIDVATVPGTKSQYKLELQSTQKVKSSGTHNNPTFVQVIYDETHSPEQIVKGFQKSFIDGKVINLYSEHIPTQNTTPTNPINSVQSSTANESKTQGQQRKKLSKEVDSLVKNISDELSKLKEHHEKTDTNDTSGLNRLCVEIDRFAQDLKSARKLSKNIKDFEEKYNVKMQEANKLDELLESDLSLSGIDQDLAKKDIGSINNYFCKYTLEAIKELLELRLRNVNLIDTEVLENNYNFQENYNNIQAMIIELDNAKSSTILVPLSLYNKHAVGLMFIKQVDHSIKAYYLDPSNKPIPSQLKQLLLNQNLQFEQLIVEQQKYSNCGPEVIENFMLYLTGEPLSQEDSVIFHSLLFEEEIMKISNDYITKSNEIIAALPIDNKCILINTKLYDNQSVEIIINKIEDDIIIRYLNSTIKITPILFEQILMHKLNVEYPQYNFFLQKCESFIKENTSNQANKTDKYIAECLMNDNIDLIIKDCTQPITAEQFLLLGEMGPEV